jgi:hypothetical protein
MKSLLARRNLFLILIVLALLALVALAAGLHDVHFAEPLKFGSNESKPVDISFNTVFEQLADVPLWKQIVFCVEMFFLILFVSALLTPKMRKWLLRLFLRLTIIGLAIMYLIKNREALGLLNLNSLTAGLQDSTTQAVNLTPPTFTPPDLPPALIYVVSMAVLFLTFGLLWWFGRGFLALRTRPSKSTNLLDELAAVTRLSLRDLGAGQHWEDAILRCYASMTEVVSRRRGLHRDAGMTPSEFAARLEQSGLPADAVRRLTRLFESVRYGARTSGALENVEAADCLREVLHYCGETA